MDSLVETEPTLPQIGWRIRNIMWVYVGGCDADPNAEKYREGDDSRCGD